MRNNVFPTKGNLLSTKKSMALAKMGFELLDRKRNILVREMMQLIDKANSLRSEINDVYNQAYKALQMANITLGICEDIAKSVPVEQGVQITYRSVMGVEIPTVTIDTSELQMPYGFLGSNSQLDKAYISFYKAKLVTVELAEIENSVYRLANAIKKTQSRANALKNIIIPNFEETTKFITDALEEKEREEFSRLKVIKSSKERKKVEQ
ncbi:V-type ATP synthase subunit D [Oscillospiraceae bacterium NSJ-54]|uniref:V-type ATP synthase subunit D n=2 Tax=Zongyangia hominis TaxID=2763677 RepID=A0A926EA57_9FIRM|nr:V-type ATP synthase subunit D [Zongyangia hominis]MBC8570142.1 V-type ATP synthase subunit D [Zongyangia hominis]